LDVIFFLIHPHFWNISVKNVGKVCTIKGLNDFFQKYVLIVMKIVGIISSKEEALQIQSIAKLSIVAQRARFLGRNEKRQNN